MPFIVPFLPTIVGAAGSIIGGKLASKATKPNEQQQTSNRLLEDVSRQGMESSTQSRNLGMQYLNRFSNTLSQPQSYFQAFLSGSPAAATGALSPDIARQQQTSQSTLQTASNLQPRGGGRSSTLFDLPFKQQANTEGLFNTARPMAASELTRIAGQQGQIGANVYGSAPGFLQAAGGAAGTLGRQAGDQQDQAFRAGQGMGGLFGQLGTSLGGALSTLFKPRAGGGGSSGSTPFNIFSSGTTGSIFGGI